MMPNRKRVGRDRNLEGHRALCDPTAKDSRYPRPSQAIRFIFIHEMQGLSGYAFLAYCLRMRAVFMFWMTCVVVGLLAMLVIVTLGR